MTDEPFWSRQDGRYRTEVTVAPYANGGGEVRADRVGPRGGRSNIYVAFSAEGAERLRELIARERELQTQVLRALDEIYG